LDGFLYLSFGHDDAAQAQPANCFDLDSADVFVNDFEVSRIAVILAPIEVRRDIRAVTTRAQSINFELSSAISG
jgi:hypothetical protein